MAYQELMKPQIQVVTILFADISRSSRMYEILGDRTAQKVIGGVLSRLGNEALRYAGHVVKTVGDCVIATFDSTDAAVEAAKAMMQAMARPFSGIKEIKEIPYIHIHIGIHRGSVVLENGDIFGDAVNISARVLDYANPRQIVATRAAMEGLTEPGSHPHRFLGSICVKNISNAIDLIEVVFEPRDLTAVLDTRKLADAACASCLHLNWRDQLLVVDGDRPVVSVGREEYNDLVIPYAWISRTHAYIENRNGVFIIHDKSTNGTFLYTEAAEAVWINKGEQVLYGQGRIIFGRQRGHGQAEELSDCLCYAVR